MSHINEHWFIGLSIKYSDDKVNLRALASVGCLIDWHEDVIFAHDWSDFVQSLLVNFVDIIEP